MRRIVLDMKNGLLAEAVTQSLSGCDMDFLIYRSPKPEETLALCRTCRANVLVMEVIRQGLWKLSERLRLCSAVRRLGWACKVLLLVDESTDELLASEVRQTVKDQLADGFIYASVANLPCRRNRHALRKGWVRNENALCIAKRGREYIKKRDEGKQHWAQPEACRPAYNAFPLQGNHRKRLCNTT